MQKKDIGDNKMIRKWNAKDCLMKNVKLTIMKNQEELYHLDNIQTLYLYPLTIFDYIAHLKNKDCIFLNILKISHKINYEELFSKKEYKNLKAVEFLIREDYQEKDYQTIEKIIQCLRKKNIKISFNIERLNSCYNTILWKYGSYFKIMLPKNQTKEEYNNFLMKIKEIPKSKEKLIHIKGYLEEDKGSDYENMILDFSKVSVDIFQLSKELIPLGIKNKKINNNIEKKIRQLEEKYKDYNKTKFISVKDLTTLYYPRFELRNQNSRSCYASRMKPYLLEDRILPCKVKKILDNLEEYSSNYNDWNAYLKIIKNCGKHCTDCASIFENDALDSIQKCLDENGMIEIRG